MGNSSRKETTPDGRSIYERETLGSANAAARQGKSGEQQSEASIHEGSINCMALSEDGSLLVTGSEDCNARLWSTKTDATESLGALEGHTSYITCVAIIKEFVVTGSADRTIRKWDMVTNECVFIYEGHENNINRIVACGDDYFFSSSYDKTARLWHFDTNREAEQENPCYRVYHGHQGPVYPILFIPASPSEDSDSEDSEDGCYSELSEDIVVTGSNDRTAKSWSLDSDYSLQTFRGHTQPLSCMVADEDGTTLFTAATDRTIRIWEINTAICRKVLEGHEMSITCMQLAKKQLYSGSTDQTARCWVTEFGECTRTYESHKHSVTCLKVAGGVVYTGCNDTMARAFDAKSGALKRTYRGHTAGISCLQYIDGKLFTGSSDGTLRVWDATKITEDQPEPGEECDETCKEHMAEQNKRLMEVDRRLSGPIRSHQGDVRSLKDDAGSLKSDVGSLKDDVGSILDE